MPSRARYRVLDRSLLILGFCLSIGFVFYTYAGHPLLLWMLARWRPRPWKRERITPSVAVYVSAFNEEKAIASKLANLLDQDYQGEYVVVVANDGSDDQTAEIVGGLDDERIQLWDFPENRGKAAMQNEVVPQLESEIVVFTDATSVWQPDTVRRLTEHFADPDVGAVSADIRFARRGEAGVELGQGAYWRYERFLRTQAARVWTNVVCSGTCYAIRRPLFRPVPLDVGEDMANPITVAFGGHRVLFDPETWVEEVSTTTHAAEGRMRRRIAVRNTTALFRYWRCLHPRFGMAAFQLLVHKYMRCTCWLPMTLCLITSGLLASQLFFALIFWGQSIFYLLALAGMFQESRGRPAGRLSLPYYFALINFAYAIALVDYLSGVRRATWQPER
jgi:cellulose synthase/poly-beta-1,6-N-acetylglucosamine synthase-like glycosyltransferase